jgi:hypothetical protein
VRSVRALIGVVTLLAATPFGCAWFSRPENALARGQDGAPGVKRFLVCAPNTVIALPAELSGVTTALREQIDAYLHFHERDTQWLDLVESRQIWSEAVAAAKQSGPIEKAPVFFAAKLDERYDFDAIVMPSIVLHKARATDGGAVWDGVSRQMELVNRPRMPSGGQDTFAEGVASGGVTGDVLVTSVHVLVFSREGQRIFEGRGGFAFVHDADLANAREKWVWKYRLRNLAKDVEEMREGIAIAFDPYLPEAD